MIYLLEKHVLFSILNMHFSLSVGVHSSKRICTQEIGNSTYIGMNACVTQYEVQFDLRCCVSASQSQCMITLLGHETKQNIFCNT